MGAERPERGSSREYETQSSATPPGQAERYELPSVEDMAGASIRFPRWEV